MEIEDSTYNKIIHLLKEAVLIMNLRNDPTSKQVKDCEDSVKLAYKMLKSVKEYSRKKAIKDFENSLNDTQKEKFKQLSI